MRPFSCHRLKCRFIKCVFFALCVIQPRLTEPRVIRVQLKADKITLLFNADDAGRAAPRKWIQNFARNGRRGRTRADFLKYVKSDIFRIRDAPPGRSAFRAATSG